MAQLVKNYDFGLPLSKIEELDNIERNILTDDDYASSLVQLLLPLLIMIKRRIQLLIDTKITYHCSMCAYFIFLCRLYSWSPSRAQYSIISTKCLPMISLKSSIGTAPTINWPWNKDFSFGTYCLVWTILLYI